ncbi:hypothetical protein ACFLV9_01070 [Chloroflexota bacterium]
MLPLIKRTMQVTIVGDNTSEKCDVRYGVDWSLVEVTALASQRIKDRFGGKTQLEYLDLSKPIANRYSLELIRGNNVKRLSLPLLLVNGESRIVGLFDIRLLLDAINAELDLNYE